MKTIKAIRASKNVEVGKIKRVSEKEADSEVRSKYWEYVPKSEWKALTKEYKSTEETETKEVTQPKQKKNVKKNS